MAVQAAFVFILALILLFHCSEAADGECEVGFGNLSTRRKPQYTKKETQYIVPGMNFTCDGNITEWNIAASVPRNRPKQHFIALQLWRVQGTNASGVSLYSLVKSQVFSAADLSRTSSTVLTFSPTPEMSFSSGDVVGFHISAAPQQKSPLCVLLDSEASSFTMYEEPHTGTATVADVSSSFSTISTVSPLISVVVRTATPAAGQPAPSPQYLEQAGLQLPNQTNATDQLSTGAVIGIAVGVYVFLLAAAHVAIGICVVLWKERHKGQLFVLSSAVGDIRTSLLRVGEESPSSRRDDERCLSVAYENEVMGSRGLTSGAYYNLPDPARTRDASARSGQSSNSSTLYHFVQSMDSRDDSDLDNGSVFDELEAVYAEVTDPALEDQEFVEPPFQLEGLFGCLATRKCIEIPVEALRTTSTLGTGQFGEVRRGFIDFPHGEKEVAVKRLKEGASQMEKVKFLQEPAVMKQFHHPNVLRLVGVVTQTEPCMLVLEYAHRGDLRAYLISRRPDPGVLPDACLRAQQLRFCREIANGMKYLSKKGFIHRDLAARNVLLDGKLTCKIADFGLSKNLDSGYYYSEGGMVPVKWTAPEGIFYKKYTTKSDVWSYGMVMYEIWSLGDKPFPHLTAQEVVRKLQTDPQYVQPPPNGCPSDIYKLMVLCWNYNYNRRPGFDAILSALFCLDEEEVAILDDVQ